MGGMIVLWILLRIISYRHTNRRVAFMVVSLAPTGFGAALSSKRTKCGRYGYEVELGRIFLMIAGLGTLV